MRKNPRKNKIDQDRSIVLRLDALMNLAGADFVHELIEVFLQIGRKDFQTMTEAFRNSTPDKFFAAAFSLKATSLNMGATELSEFCKLAESNKIFSSKTKTQETLDQIESKLTGAEDFLRDYIRETHSSAS